MRIEVNEKGDKLSYMDHSSLYQPSLDCSTPLTMKISKQTGMSTSPVVSGNKSINSQNSETSSVSFKTANSPSDSISHVSFIPSFSQMLPSDFDNHDDEPEKYSSNVDTTESNPPVMFTQCTDLVSAHLDDGKLILPKNGPFDKSIDENDAPVNTDNVVTPL